MQTLLWYKFGYFFGYGAVLVVIYTVPESILFARDRGTEEAIKSKFVEAVLWLAVVSECWIHADGQIRH